MSIDEKAHLATWAQFGNRYPTSGDQFRNLLEAYEASKDSTLLATKVRENENCKEQPVELSEGGWVDKAELILAHEAKIEMGHLANPRHCLREILRVCGMKRESGILTKSQQREIDEIVGGLLGLYESDCNGSATIKAAADLIERYRSK
ncbi:hypothetical protein [Zavarzinella formosa]|uniref:hypothetical protein n=1 Tax=Zavarzinella formosa TaxID=360055 RepID=UPI0003713CB8|nr:hypothetical protein [Zavarzinella formosa]